ncbi:PulJ/GspJ family protein [Stutzerimonas xanthomarina]|uniref:PulJ/GspJ family protein n=1 Tax=Stutzerimonas xanthomarina TaxID=271420 RepID=UPI003AA7B462
MPLTIPPVPVGASLLAITPSCPTRDRQQAGSYTSNAPPSVDATGQADPPHRGRPDLGAKLLAFLAGSESVFAAGRASHKSTEHGFTLVELIMVIALSGIVAVMISTVLSRPLQGFVDQSRRAELTDLAAMALNRMARDIRLAVPNSIRNEPGCSPETECKTLEMLEIIEGGRYRANQLSPGGERYDPPRCLGGPVDCYIPVLSPGLQTASANWMVIYSTDNQIWSPSITGASTSVITPTDASISLADCPADGEDAGNKCLKLDNTGAFSFRYASPQNRFYLVNNAIGYRCVEKLDGSWELRRANPNGLSPSYARDESALVVNSISSCSFTYEPGANTRNGVVTMRLSLTNGGETVTLLQQVHVDNAP